MAWLRNVKGGRSWFGSAEAKANGRRARRQEDRDRIHEDAWTHPDPDCRVGSCGGYGGWWSSELGEGVEWALHPATQDDGVGYVICPCMAADNGDADQPAGSPRNGSEVQQ